MTTDTPDVDAAAFEERGLPGSLVVHADFARRLRRELDKSVESYKSLMTENKALAVKIESDAALAQQQQTLLDKQKEHSLALQRIIKAICADMLSPTEAAAPEYSKMAHAFIQSQQHSADAALAAHEAQQKGWNDERQTAKEELAAISAEADKTAAVLTQQVSDLELRIEALQELSYELAAKKMELME